MNFGDGPLAAHEAAIFGCRKNRIATKTFSS
jgi:hypothetical protein